MAPAKPRTPRVARELRASKFQAIFDFAEQLRPLVESPAFSGFFAAIERELQDAMVNAAIDDDLGRRNAAIRLSILRDLKKHFTDCVSRGGRAAEELARLEAEAKQRDKTNAE